MSKATILLPNYNNGLYLIDCLESIQSQTFSDFKILIIDDGSTDNSIDIIKNFNDSRIKLIQKDNNSGIIDTLNIGLSNIDSEYIIRMDGDDLMHSERIERLIHFMDNNQSFGACGSGIKHFGLSDDEIIYESNPKTNKANLVFRHSIGHASSIYRTSVIQKNNIRYSNGFNYLEDYKFFYDLSKVTQMTSLSDLLYFYRREEYNNYKNIDIKKIGFLKMYKEILTSLGFDDVEKSAMIHYEISHHTSLNYSIKTYKNHLKSLIYKNNLYNIFPHKEYKKVIHQANNKLFYKLTEQSKLSLPEGLDYFIKSPKKLYYFIRVMMSRK
jgi:glycosyltransferase involved in cell wall biosynthesis